jgi:hypothetical protein
MSAVSARKTALLALSLLALCAAVPTCSLSNKEGPAVTCADLQCGKLNDCHDGIIASCLDGKTMKYYVCYENGQDICDEEWQIRGQYRCEEHMPDCVSCSPTAAGCGNSGSGGGGDGGIFDDSDAGL